MGEKLITNKRSVAALEKMKDVTDVLAVVITPKKLSKKTTKNQLKKKRKHQILLK